MESLSAKDQHEFEEQNKKLIKEVEVKYLSNFKVDMHQKVVRQQETDLTLLRPIATTPNVSNTNDI